MKLVVQKYGGTSVGTLPHIQNVARHIATTAARGQSVVVTISAMGEQTDDLLAMAAALSPRPPRRELDMLLTSGERISASLLAIALDALGLPSVSLTGSQCGILTDETHGNARITRILGDRIRAGLAQGKVVIVAGFQGVSPRTKDITTLGRGGTDLSAVALAAALGADSCQLYKDVKGVYTADPRVVGSARVLARLSWEAMTALAWGGAAVLHPRGAHLAAKFGIPFEIRSSLALDHIGTLIDGRTLSMESPTVVALSHKHGMSLVASHVGAPAAASLIAAALAWLWRQGEAPLLSSQVGDGRGGFVLTQVISTALASDYVAMLSDLAGTSGGRYELARRQDGLATVTVVGAGFQQSPELVLKALEALEAPPLLVDTRNTAITLCVEQTGLEQALSGLHRSLLSAEAQATGRDL